MASLGILLGLVLFDLAGRHRGADGAGGVDSPEWGRCSIWRGVARPHSGWRPG